MGDLPQRTAASSAPFEQRLQVGIHGDVIRQCRPSRVPVNSGAWREQAWLQL